ncbi:MAG TPA: hypothetical protein VNE39_17720 [Planctomycetota bacterium]|nr:hypothetical protein [Planctomycetota bacterium]
MKEKFKCPQCGLVFSEYTGLHGELKLVQCPNCLCICNRKSNVVAWVVCVFVLLVGAVAAWFFFAQH